MIQTIVFYMDSVKKLSSYCKKYGSKPGYRLHAYSIWFTLSRLLFLGREIMLNCGSETHLPGYGQEPKGKINIYKIWRGVRVVEGARLESVYTVKRIKGSNPFLSAKLIVRP